MVFITDSIAFIDINSQNLCWIDVNFFTNHKRGNQLWEDITPGGESATVNKYSFRVYKREEVKSFFIL